MKNDLKIAIVDYGVGNLYSLVRAFEHFDIQANVTEDAEVLKEASAIVLPGVGSFEAGMRGLEIRELVPTIQEIAESGKPILGICLGAQLMLSEGHEFGIFKGLDIIKGKVVRFPNLDNNEKVPHIGWNTISPPKNRDWKNTVLDSLDSKNSFYFVHSYILEPESEENIFSLTEYGGHTFCSMIRKENIYGCQFHPEKSGETGLKLIKNFINIVKNKPQ